MVNINPYSHTMRMSPNILHRICQSLQFIRCINTRQMVNNNLNLILAIICLSHLALLIKYQQPFDIVNVYSPLMLFAEKYHYM